MVWNEVSNIDRGVRDLISIHISYTFKPNRSGLLLLQSTQVMVKWRKESQSTYQVEGIEGINQNYVASRSELGEGRETLKRGGHN